MKLLKRNTVIGTALIVLGTSAAWADSFEGDAKDAWITGKIETVFLLNGHLNNFKIDTDVNNGVAKLSGTVKSDIERDLAVNLAKGVDGVVEVDDALMVDTNVEIADDDREVREDGRTFGTWVDDATTTAAVKSRLIGNSNVAGLEIDVDTMGDVVTLSGRVNSDAEKSLAEEIASTTGDVREVRNNLVVDPE